jgi:hypothetical protein
LNTAPTGHSRFGFSAAHRWLHCTASVQASAGIDDTSSAEAEYGTMLHEVAAATLLGEHFDHEVDAAGQQQIAIYVAHVLSRRAQLHADLLVEHQFHLDKLDAELWGTADVVLFGGGHFEVIDLKTGGGVAVEVREPDGSINPQLGGYLLGAMMSVPGHIKSCSMTIVQPRRGGIKTTEVDILELEQLAARLVRALDQARNAPEFHPGEHCRFCRAKNGCEAYRRKDHLIAAALF